MDDDINATLLASFLNNASDPSIGSFTEEEMDPTRDPLYIVVPMTIIYVIIFITGVVGNVSTCVVISRNKSMHTATNYYLFSLAISDLLLLISGLPQEMYSIWSRYPYVFGEVFCVLRGLAAETSANATVLTITAFTIERYVAICHPFLSHTMSKLSRAIKLILLIWIVALAFAIPQALQFGLVLHQNAVFCTQKIVILVHSFEISTFLFFITPMTLITVLYALIGLRLRSSNMMKREGTQIAQNNRSLRSGTSMRGGGPRRGTSQSSRRVLKMLVAVVVAFFICWAPFHAQRLVYIYGTKGSHQATSATMHTIYAIMTYISGIFYYLSTTINPVLYHIMSYKFREAFKEAVARWCGSSGGGPEGAGREYAVLARTAHRHPGLGVNGQDSTDYSGNSVREESVPCVGPQYCEPLRPGRGGWRGAGDSPAPLSHSLSVTLSPTPIMLTQHPGSSKQCQGLYCKPYTTNVSFKNDFPCRVHIHFNDNETNTGMCHYGIRSPGCCLNKVTIINKTTNHETKCWHVFKCISAEKDRESPYALSNLDTKLTVENETQTDAESTGMARRSRGCSSREDRGAPKDELTTYMEEVHRREKRYGSSQYAV